MLAAFSFTGKAALKIDPVYLCMAAVLLAVLLLNLRYFTVFLVTHIGVAVSRITLGYCAVRAFFRVKPAQPPGGDGGGQ